MLDALILSIRDELDPERRVIRVDAALTMIEQMLAAASLLTVDQIERLSAAWNNLLDL